MKLKRGFLLAVICCLVVLVGCSAPPTPKVEEGVSEDDSMKRQLLSNEATAEYYRTMLPYKTSPTRGLVYSRYSKMNNRYDIDAFELALMRESQAYFSPDQVYFQEGQNLTKAMVQRLLSKRLTEAELAQELEVDANYKDIGLNPTKDERINIDGMDVNPVYLAYLLEQDYVVTKDENTVLEGVTIGLALNPYQNWKNELGYDQTIVLDEEALIEKGKEIATRLIDILRQEEAFKDVPIMIGLFIVQEESAVTPGHMVAKTLVGKNSSTIKNWESVNEKYYLLPDSAILAVDANLSNQFSSFKDTIKEYYPHYYGVIGLAHVLNNKVDNLEIIINIDFYGLAEKLSFHQLVAQLIPDSFSSDYDIDVVIRSSDEIYGILKKSANEREVTLKLTGWK